MFEDMAVSAVNMLIIMFWTILVFMLISGAVWLRSLRHTKKEA